MNIRNCQLKVPEPMPLKNIAQYKGIHTLLDSGFHTVGSGFQVQDSEFLVSELGIRIPILSGIHNSFSCITYSKAQDFGFQVKISRIVVSGFPYMGRQLYLGAGYSSLMVYRQVAQNQSHIARNAELIGSKFYHASTISEHPYYHLLRLFRLIEDY